MDVSQEVTNLGASIGTALAGAVLIAMLTSFFLAGVQNNPDIPKNVASQAQVDLAGGIPVHVRRGSPGRPRQGRRRDRRRERRRPYRGLRSSLSLLAIIALIALFLTRQIPARQPSAAPTEPSADHPA
jgi:hypothetical protein